MNYDDKDRTLAPLSATGLLSPAPRQPRSLGGQSWQNSALTANFAALFADNPGDKHVSVNFVQDTSKFWYKADISREQGACGRGLGKHCGRRVVGKAGHGHGRAPSSAQGVISTPGGHGR